MLDIDRHHISLEPLRKNKWVFRLAGYGFWVDPLTGKLYRTDDALAIQIIRDKKCTEKED